MEWDLCVLDQLLCSDGFFCGVATQGHPLDMAPSFPLPLRQAQCLLRIHDWCTVVPGNQAMHLHLGSVVLPTSPVSPQHYCCRSQTKFFLTDPASSASCGRAHHSADLVSGRVLPPLDDVWVLPLEFRTALDFKVPVALESSLDVS